MRLDLGSDGKIIGTRRVSPNGQVSGLSEFAGKEVLVILPGSAETSSASPPSWTSSEGLTQMVSEQIREAYERYRSLQEAYATPWEATRSFMQSAFGTPFPDLLAQIDRWVKSQVQDAQANRTSPPTGTSDEGAHRSTRGGSSSASRRSGAPGRKRP